MIREVLLLFLLFVQFTIFSQDVKRLRVSTSITNPEFFDDRISVSINLIVSGAQSFNYSNVLWTNPFKEENVFIVPNDFTMSSRLKLEGCSFNNYTWNRTVTADNFHNASSMYTGACGANISVLPFYLDPIEVDGSNTFCKHDSFFLRSGSSWKYSVDGGDSWVFFGNQPGTLQSEKVTGLTLTTNFKEISNDYDYTGNVIIKATHFRAESNYRNITIVPCSPKLIEDPEPIGTKCSYSNDGKFTMKVDRDLLTNEKLVISLYKENDLVPNTFDFFTQENTTVLQNNGDGSFSYTWQGNLVPVRYQIKFQILLGDGGIPNTDSSWASLNFSNPFTISKGENVNFIVTHMNDENCFESGDGKIQLNITSGETSTYRYIVYKVDGSTETIYKNWTVFSGRSTVIENLEKNKYRIKVQDNKNCFARNP